MHKNYRTDIMNRIESKSTKRDNGCIEYACGTLTHKYGLVSITIDGKRKNVPAHRAYYMAINNCFDLPSNVVVRHKCDNPRCVNIMHLLCGSHADNVRDKIERGRCAKSHKYAQRLRLHDDAKIEAIRNATGKHAWIALEHGVSVGYVSKIKNGKLKR